MKDADLLELSNDAGIVATVVLTFNFLLGMLLATAYKKNRYWQKLPQRIRETDVNNLHNWTAYVALILVFIHPLLLLLAPSTKFTFVDIIFPLNAPNQKIFVALGTLSMFALIIVIITTQKKLKRMMSFRTWKNIHLISYGTALLFVVHGIFMDQHLKDQSPDFFDGEKLISELCGISLTVASVLRYKYYLKTKREV
ncbi:MAG TPA: ferric reductase-like transmembrane domain-containing protein [Puia sp.]|nr:ferric reductase-like transmembrane domain-containing protein [Puia sp.]